MNINQKYFEDVVFLSKTLYEMPPKKLHDLKQEDRIAILAFLNLNDPKGATLKPDLKDRITHLKVVEQPFYVKIFHWIQNKFGRIGVEKLPTKLATQEDFDQIVSKHSSRPIRVRDELLKQGFSPVISPNIKISGVLGNLDLKGIVFQGVQFENFNFDDCYVEDVLFENCRFEGSLEFSSCTMTNAVFKGCTYSPNNIDEELTIKNTTIEKSILDIAPKIDSFNMKFTDFVRADFKSFNSEIKTSAPGTIKFSPHV